MSDINKMTDEQVIDFAYDSEDPLIKRLLEIIMHLELELKLEEENSSRIQMEEFGYGGDEQF